MRQQERRIMTKKQGHVPPSDPIWSDQWSLVRRGEGLGNNGNVEYILITVEYWTTESF